MDSCEAGAGVKRAVRCRWLGYGALLLLLAAATWLGAKYHRWAFDATENWRFGVDIRRNYGFGLAALDQSYLGIYEDQARNRLTMEQRLDYPPLRLATFMGWVAWNRWRGLDSDYWQGDYNFNAFLMWHNQVLEWLAAVAAFLIVRYWLREAARAALPLGCEPSAGTGIFRASLAFLFVWFDPGIAIIAHGWPSPNMWVVPYYLWTVYLCLRDRWFWAGLVMAVGAMLQGQQMFVAAIFILWPLFAGRPSRAFRWVCGFGMAFALIAAGWLLSTRPNPLSLQRSITWPAVAWVAGSVTSLAVVGLRTMLHGRLHWRWFSVPGGVAVWVLTYPVRSVLTVGAAAALVLLFWFASWRLKRYALGLVLGLCLFACIPLYGGGDSWWTIGFLYGADRFNVMAWPSMNNLPAILQRFGWYQVKEIVFTLPEQLVGNWPEMPLEVTIRDLLFCLFVVLLVAAAVAIAMQWRRRDPRLLVSLVLPWVLFYSIPSQMSPRYPVFISGVGAICVGGSAAMWLLVLMFSALTVQQTMLTMMGDGYLPSMADDLLFNTEVRHVMRHFSPGMSWAVVLAAGTFLCISFARCRVIVPAAETAGELPEGDLSRR